MAMAEILFLRFQKRMGNITVATYTFDTIYEENVGKKTCKRYTFTTYQDYTCAF